jgi:hypothetical protein
MPFLPVYGIRGFGYHRYAFVVYHHEQKLKLDKIDTNELQRRQIDAKSLGSGSPLTPVGLSWFQTSWDSSAQKVLHNQLNMRAPVYEYIQAEETNSEQALWPQSAAFNLYLDRYRETKELNKYALVERLKNVDPFNYKKEFEIDPIPNAYGKSWETPSWIWSTIWKKRNRVGPWRNLRPASALIAHSNNADLDKPNRCVPHLLDIAQRYPDGKRRPKPIRETKWAIPPQDHPTYRVDHIDEHKLIEEQDSKE